MKRVYLPLRMAGLEVAAARGRMTFCSPGVGCRLDELFVVTFFAAGFLRCAFVRNSARTTAWFTAGSRAAYTNVALLRPICRRISIVVRVIAMKRVYRHWQFGLCDPGRRLGPHAS